MEAKTKVPPLYMAKSLEELNKQVSSVELLSKSKPKLILNTAEKLYNEADIVYRHEGDEEKCYVLLMRFLNSIQIIRDPKKSDPAVVKMINPTHFATAIERCEKLSKSLSKRYELAREVSKREEEGKKKEYQEAAENEKKRHEPKLPKTPTVNGIISKAEESHDIDPVELKNLIEQKSSRILIVDCRDASDFSRSHPQHPNSISIPSVILVPGLSAQKITDRLQQLNPDACRLWSSRHDFDYIVLYDWNSSFEARDPSCPISVLYDSMTRWDPSTKYKGKKLILRGGIRNMYYSYPSLLTNPKSFSDETVVRKSDHSLTNPLDSILYPNADGSIPVPVVSRKSPSPIPKLPINAFSRIENHLATDKEIVPPPTANSTPPSVVNVTPPIEVDRSSKPVGKFTASSASIVNNKANIPNGGGTVPIPSETVAAVPEPAPKPGLSNGHVSKTIDVPGAANGIANGYGTYTNGIPDSPDSDGDKKDSSGFAGLSKSLDSSSLAPMRPSGPKPNLSSATPSSASAGSQRPASQDASTSGSYTMKLKNEPSEPRMGGGLKRSHSHPNLAQQSFENEDSQGPTVPEIPSFSRNLKPIAVRSQASETYGARRREFQVVSSTEWTKTGLKNLGNTCYMNSIMQCLNTSTMLVDYFTKEAYKADCRGNGPTRGETTEEIAAAIKEMNLGHRSIALNDLKAAVGQVNKAFRGTDQHDSHEFLTIILDCMHEELNRAKVKVPLKEQNNDGVPDDEAAKIVWKDYLLSNDSIITHLFCGEIKSTVRCLYCSKESVTFGQFFVLSIPLPSPSKKCTISQCLDLYTSEEEIHGYNCVHCKTKCDAKKKLDLWRLPPYLILHLQRFYNDGWWKKRLTEVEFPVDRLDLTSKVKGLRNGMKDRTGYNYQLYGVSNHYGSMEGGHYTAYCRKASNWFKYNDQEVSQASARDVVTSAAYILFYQNQGF